MAGQDLVARRRMHGEAGLTLVELLVTIAIIGIAFGVLVGGMGTAVLGSDLHRKQSDVENILRSFAETVKASAYVNCATPASYQSLYTPPTGYTATVTKVEFAPPPFNTFVNACTTQVREPVGFDPATTTFANPTNAYVIGEAPTPLTADATLQVGPSASATITLTGYGSVPAGATLRVVHGEDLGASPTVSVSSGTLDGALTSGTSLHEDRLTFTASGSSISVTYSVSAVAAALTGASLDGIWLEFTDPAATDPGLQRVTLEVKAKGRPVTQEVQLVLRKPT